MTDLSVPPSSDRALAPYREGGFPTLYGPEHYGLPPGHEETLLQHYLRVLYRNRWLVAGVTFFCLALALIITMLMQPLFTATARIEIAREAANVVDVEGVESEVTGSSQEFYQTQYALLKSRSLSELVARDLQLGDNFSFLTGWDEENIDELRQESLIERTADATSILNKRTTITPIPGSGVVDISYTAANPQFAAAAANSIAENFIQMNLDRRYEATAYARRFLENRINSVRQKLEESERKAAQYAQAQGIIKIAGEGEGRVSSEQTLASADLAQLSSQLALARAARVQAEADYRANSGGTAAASSLTNPAVNALREQRGELSAELSKLESDFGPKYPRVVALKSQIAELDRQIGREQSRVTSSVSQSLRDKYRQALAAEQALQARVNGLKSAVLDQQQRSIQFNIIQRDVDTNRSLYDALLQRFKEVGVGAGVGTNNVSIVDTALPPAWPSSPNLPLNLAIGLMGGLLLGGGLALVREQLADTVVVPADFNQKLGIRLLGTTPKLSRQNVKAEIGQPDSSLSEAYLSLLTAIRYSTPSVPGSMLFTSTQAGEGKSTTALAVARNLASSGARVLLVDGDLRRPALHRQLDLPMTAGLSALLEGRAQLAEAVQQVGSSRLSILLAGRTPSNPAELLSTGALDRVLTAAGASYDHVIIDGPPVLGLADSVLFARATNATVFVIEAGKTKASQARFAIERLRAVRADILGAVLTKLNAKEAGYGDTYAYQYSYAQRERATGFSRFLPQR